MNSNSTQHQTKREREQRDEEIAQQLLAKRLKLPTGYKHNYTMFDRAKHQGVDIDRTEYIRLIEQVSGWGWGLHLISILLVRVLASVFIFKL